MSKDISYTTNEIIDEMNQYYDTRAPWHDDFMSFESCYKMEQQVQPVLQKFIKLIENITVLEIACGTGNWTHLLAKHAKHVQATDFSPKSLELAKKKFSNHENITFINDDAYKLEQITNPVDIIFAADWWSHIPNESIDEFVNICKQKSKPNAPMIFLDMTCKKFFKDEKYYFDSNNNRISLRKLPDGSEYKVIKNFHTRAEFKNIFTKQNMNVKFYEFDVLERWMVIASNLEPD